MTRAEICTAACEGLSDDQVRALVTAGGLSHVLDCHGEATSIMEIVRLAQTYPRVIDEAKGNFRALRPVLVEMLADIDAL